jgi:uncharacterized protein (DUF58 family)
LSEVAVTTGNADALLQRIEWTVLRRLDGLLHGDYRTLYRGFGIDLADLREYQYHDDVRHIDWNVTARLQIPHVRQFVEDREVTAWFLIDLTESMQFGSGAMRKSEQMLESIALLARVLTKHGNRIGALIYRGGDQIAKVLPVGHGRRHVLALIDLIREPKKTEEKKSAAVGTDLSQFFKQAGNMLKRRSLVFVASDFISQTPWHIALGHLARRHETIALRSEDPLELALPDLGLVVMQDSETGEQLVVDTHDAGFRSRFAHLAQARRQQLETNLVKAGVDSLVVGSIENLLSFAARRKHALRKTALSTTALSTTALSTTTVSRK